MPEFEKKYYNSIVKIKLDKNQVEIESLIISDSEISNLLKEISDKDRPEMIRRALKIGLLALKSSSTTEKVDYIEKEFNRFKSNVESIMQDTNENIKNNLGDIFSDKGILKVALENYLGEGGKIKDLFDENKKDSAIGKIAEIMSRHFEGDGSILKKMLDSSNISSPLYLLRQEILDNLRKIENSINIKKATEEVENKGTRKGIDYEELVANEVDKIARILEDNVYKVGSSQGDNIKSKAGDIVSKVNPKNTNNKELIIVFEAKDRPLSLGTILSELDQAKVNRNADAAIAVFSSLVNSPAECGVFRIYAKERIICVLDKDNLDPTMLQVAYKVAVALALVKRAKDEHKEDTVDIERIFNSINSIRDRIKTFSSIKSNLTSVKTYIAKVQDDLDDLRDELLGNAADIEIAVGTNQEEGTNKNESIENEIIMDTKQIIEPLSKN